MLFWDDATRADRFRRMEDFFAGHRGRRRPRVAQAARRNRRTMRRPRPRSTPISRARTRRGSWCCRTGACATRSTRSASRREQRWTSFSVAKSFTSTLLGAAVKDGFVASMDDPVTKYLPKLAGTAYDGVSVEQLATMTSGVKWNEDYADANSDVARMLQVAPVAGESQAITYARQLTREAPAGRKWVYKTLETNLIGDLVAAATGRSLAAYAKEKIVDPAGFAGPMFWMTDLTGGNIGGCCLSLRLSDYARFGQFALEGGQPSVPAGWFVSAGAAQVDLGKGYRLRLPVVDLSGRELRRAGDLRAVDHAGARAPAGDRDRLELAARDRAGRCPMRAARCSTR